MVYATPVFWEVGAFVMGFYSFIKIIHSSTYFLYLSTLFFFDSNLFLIVGIFKVNSFAAFVIFSFAISNAFS